MKNHILYSGGAYGADTAFGVYGVRYGITPDRQFHYRPNGNTNITKQLKDVGITPIILNDIEMEECYKFMHKCIDGKVPKKIVRSFGKDLCARNYYQVKNAQSIYAVVELTSDFKSVQGGTRYAVEYAKSLNKLIYVFDYRYEAWYVWVNEKEGFSLYQDGTPILFEKFAGIGSRKIQQYQIKDKNTNNWVNNPDYVGDHSKNVSLNAIKELFEKNMK